MDSVRNTGKLLLILLLPAMGILTYNHAANWHYHISPEGIPVKHAHPFNKTDSPASPFASHTHTAMEMMFLGQFAQMIFVLSLMLFLLGQMLHLIRPTGLRDYSFPFFEQLSLSLPLLRAPPLMMK
jgi:hypothetical protein